MHPTHRPVPSSILAAVLSATVALPSCLTRDSGGLRPTVKQFSSAFLDIPFGGMTADPDLGLALALAVRNKSKERVWVEVHFMPPAPNAACKSFKEMPPAAEESFECAQQTVVPDVEYPVSISVYRDANRTARLEQRDTHFRFDAATARAVEAAARSGKGSKP